MATAGLLIALTVPTTAVAAVEGRATLALAQGSVEGPGQIATYDVGCYPAPLNARGALVSRTTGATIATVMSSNLVADVDGQGRTGKTGTFEVNFTGMPANVYDLTLTCGYGMDGSLTTTRAVNVGAPTSTTTLTVPGGTLQADESATLRADVFPSDASLPSGTVTFWDATADPQDASTWVRIAANVPMDGNTAEYTGVFSRTTVVVAEYSGTAMVGPSQSAPGTVQVAAPVITAPSAVSITGEPRVGQTLSVDTGTWSPAGTTLTYAWTSGADVLGTGATFTPGPAQADAPVHVVVTGSLTGATPVSVPSASVTILPLVLDHSALALTGQTAGTALVGQALGVQGLPQVDGATTGYRWFVGDDADATSTAATYTPTTADIGEKVRVEVTTSAPGYGTETTVLRSGVVKAVLAPVTVLAIDMTGWVGSQDALRFFVEGAPAGTPYTVREGTTVLAEGTVVSGVMPPVTLPQLSVGTHDLVIEIAATASTQAASTTAQITLTAEPARSTPLPTAQVTIQTSVIGVTAGYAGGTGSRFLGSGGGFVGGETVAGYAHSEPVLLGTVVADAAGNVSFAFDLPAGMPLGTHTLILTGLDSGRWGQVTFEIVAPTAATPAAATPALAETGAEPGALLAGTWAMLLAGAVLVLLARRARVRTTR